MKMNRI